MNQRFLSQFRTLFYEYYPILMRNALFYVRDIATAEDITQEVFAILWEKRDNLEQIINIKKYLELAVKNRCLNYLKHQEIISKYQQEYIEELASENHVEELIQIVQNSLAQLPPKRRQILEMRILKALSYQEIAEELGISINTVKDHIKKAYAFLRLNLQEDLQNLILFFALQHIRTKEERQYQILQQ